jgi:MCM OB domain
MHLNHMISLEGIVTKCSLVRPKVVKSVHYCEDEDRFFFREYRDQTMTASGAASSGVYPTEDEERHPVSEFVPFQLLTNFCSLLPNTDTVHIETTKPYLSRRCLRERQPVNYLDPSM